MSKICESTEANAACCVEVPNSLLELWYIQETPRGHQSMVELLNESLPSQATINIRLGCTKAEERIRIKACLVSKKLSLQTHYKKSQMRKRSTKLNFYIDELMNVSELNQQVLSLGKQMEDAVRESAKKDEALKRVTALESTSQLPFNLGKTYDQVELRQKQRKVRTIKTAAEQALCFIESFGLSVEKVVLTSNDNVVELNYSSCSSLSATDTATDTEPDTSIDETLYLLEKFGVSDECYHELTMIHPDLPRSYKVKNVRSSVSSAVDIQRLPASQKYYGAYRPLKDYLASILSHELQDKELLSPVEIKFSGDGAKFSRSSSYILFSFSFPSLCSNILAGTGNHTFAAVKCSESYECLDEAMESVFTEINELVAEKEIELNNGNTVKLNIVAGGDMKFMLIILGMNAANSKYCCIWCEIEKNKRWDMKFDEKEYNGVNMRTLDEMGKCRAAKGIDQVKGCVRPPLLKIEPKSCVIDELHLFLRISDVLFENLFAELQRLSWRAKNARNGEPADHVQRAVSAIRKCGVSFNVWQSKEGSRQSRSGLEMTSLNRNEKLKVMNSIPDCFGDFLPQVTAVPLRNLWRSFLRIYKQLSSEAPDLNMLETETKAWVKDFLSLRLLEGHQHSSVTPYMHVFAYHVPDQIRRHGNIRRFSGQGVEKNNDDAKRHYYSGNRHDAARDILLTEARIEKLTWDTPSCVRAKRKYTKKNADYWEKEILDKRKRPSTLDETS